MPNLRYLAVLLMCLPALAVACPPLPDRGAEKDRLHAQLLAARTEMQGRAIGGQLWRIWATAPDATSQDLLDRGQARIRQADYASAEEILTELIAYCPDYAEGWNQRAFARFLRQDYGRALEDIAVALDLEPRHFGALSGRAVTLIAMGRPKTGHIALRAALKINPWLGERHLLPPGEDI